MCCGGTVATMAREVPSAIPSRRASSPTQAMSGPKLLRWGTGVPVEPEVNTQAAGCAARIAGTDIGPAGTAGLPGGRGRAPRRRRGTLRRESAPRRDRREQRRRTGAQSAAAWARYLLRPVGGDVIGELAERPEDALVLLAVGAQLHAVAFGHRERDLQDVDRV